MRWISLLALALMMPAAALAGSYEAVHVDGATAPNTFRVQVSMTADLDGQCPDYTCAWCCTGHSVTITPAPADIAPWMSPVGTNPNRFSWDMSEPGGTDRCAAEFENGFEQVGRRARLVGPDPAGSDPPGRVHPQSFPLIRFT